MKHVKYFDKSFVWKVENKAYANNKTSLFQNISSFVYNDIINLINKKKNQHKGIHHPVNGIDGMNGMKEKVINYPGNNKESR